MARYAVKAVTPRERCDWWDDDSPLIPHLEVDEHDACDTGLITASGEPIMRLPNPMGFGRDGEW